MKFMDDEQVMDDEFIPQKQVQSSNPARSMVKSSNQTQN